ncbi:hypothetical protein K505DRAFT_295246 [Melanomma pulvis-pyrius CBS 109.77]|uniref:Telomere length regulation protein conserved domain-containing protein n=1 Tax=Melanomma pulvis-pyrius CBS 109.77 TaxID=1314802 RepID=A0A6A6XSA5_9PLEO|nr:hypothetical protein K505DRAFT_295246 [Melanomma pulvis-pyrius CBS 109.77]
MTDFLTPVSTVKRSKESKPITKQVHEETKPQSFAVTSPEGALEALKDQPDIKIVGNVLRYLATESRKKDGFNLITPEPLSASIAYTLATITIPDYWRAFKETGQNGKQLVRCFSNPNGLGAILSRLRPLITDCRQKKPVGSTRDSSGHIEDLLDVLNEALAEDRVSSQIWKDIQDHAQNTIQLRLMWKEYVAQTASGRILSLVAEAEDVLKERGISRTSSWLGNGNEYASWLGRNIAVLMRDNIEVEDSVLAVTEICGKALFLGFTDHIMTSIVKSMLKDNSMKILEHFLPKMKAHEQRKYINSIITVVSRLYLSSDVDTKENGPVKYSPKISGTAAIFYALIKENELLREHVASTLSKSTLSVLDDSLAARRSVISAIAQDDEKLQTLLEQCLKAFGDTFYIAHTPILQQEALAQTLAMACGYVHRSQPMFLMLMAKSSYHVSGMSNRIGATSPRARFLGMAVGTAISSMVDKPELQLKFDLEGNEATEAKWIQRLTNVDDKIGVIKDLEFEENKSVSTQKIPLRGGAPPMQTRDTKKMPQKPSITEITGPRIVEILDESSDEDDDLRVYEKPDSDPEDDTDDPTEINRNKPTAPVYIRDLIAGLRDSENYDRHELALSTAAPLIRRKANFGSEVTDNIEELASILIGLNDNFDLPDFNEQRQSALIAVLLAKPGPMAQWFARSFFSGDYSFVQRVAMLTTMGVGARELAGLKDSSTEDLIPARPVFPSKTLPSHLHNLYASDSDPVSRITKSLTKQILSPLAASAADQLSGPNILKVRTFSSRLEVEKRRQKPIPNALAQIVAENFFFPLTGRWWINTRNSSDSLYNSTHLLPPFLHTLALLMNAAGPNTLALPQMTREFWDLLISVRVIAAKDKGVLSSLLFAFLMLLETNEDKERLATEQAKELLETQEWVRMVFEGLGAGSEEDEKIRVLAAGVLIRAQEVVEKYQRRLAGSMMDY